MVEILILAAILLFMGGLGMYEDYRYSRKAAKRAKTARGRHAERIEK